MPGVRRSPSGTIQPIAALNQHDPDAQARSRKGDLASDVYGEAELQLKRLRDYLADSLADTQSDIAMVGVVNASLLRAMLPLNDSLEEVVRECTSASRRFDTVLRGIEVLARLARQFDRLEHLKLLLGSAHRAAQRLSQHPSMGEDSAS